MVSDVGLGACEVDPVGLGSGLKGLERDPLHFI